MNKRLPRPFAPFIPGLLLVALGLLRPWLEESMARHMTLELPGLFCIGWLAARACDKALSQMLAPWNRDGVTALLAAFFITSYWMLPSALDRAVLNWDIATIKVASMLCAGLLLGAAWEESIPILRAFFVLNWAWMTLVAGFLYRDAPEQLCAVYLSDQQAATGLGLILLAIMVLGLWGSDTYLQIKTNEIND